MNKKAISIILAAAAASSIFPVNISAEPSDIRIFLNGNEMYLSDNVEVINNLTMVPAKNFMEGLGYYVEWNDLFQTLTASKVSNGFVFNVNNSEYTINGNIKHAELTPAIIRNRVYIPLDDVVRDIGLSYVWDNDNHIIDIQGEIVNPTQPPLEKLPDDQIPQNLIGRKTSSNRNNTSSNRNNTTSNPNNTVSVSKNSNKLTLSERLSPQFRATPKPDTTLRPDATPDPGTKSSPSPSPAAASVPVSTPVQTSKPVSPYKCYSRYPTVPDIQDIIAKLDFLYFENTINSSTYYYSFSRNEHDDIQTMYNNALTASGFDKNNSESSNKTDVYDRYDIKVIFNTENRSITIKGTPITAPTKGSSNNAFLNTRILKFEGEDYNNPIPFYEAYLDNKTYVCRFVTSEDDAKAYTGDLKKNASRILSVKDTTAEFMFGDTRVVTQLLNYDEKSIQNTLSGPTPSPSSTPRPTKTPVPPRKTAAPSKYNKLGVTPTPVPTTTPTPSPEESFKATKPPLLDVSSINEKDRKIFVVKIIP